jgi:predicted dehydrogenase
MLSLFCLDTPDAISAGQESIMTTLHNEDAASIVTRNASSLTGAHRRTLDAIFHHPSAHNLEWSDVVELIGTIGDVHEQSNNKFAFEVSGKRHIMHKPHMKDLTSDEVVDLRHFLKQAESSPEHPSEAVTDPDPATPDLLIVVDHHGTKIFHVDFSANEPAEDVIKPYDPHHFLHHLTHKDQSRERGQRAPEEPAYYEQIAAAVAKGGKIVVVGHGTGKSNAAHHLIEYLRSHHSETYKRVIDEIVCDLSSITTPQLLDIARKAFRQ